MSIEHSDNLRFSKIIRRVNFIDKIALILSVWFGAGLLPAMPGTFGTAGALPLVFVHTFLGSGFQILLLIAVIVISVWACNRSQRILNRADPKEVVIDEVSGFLLTFQLLPLSWPTIIGGFFLFRFFDIFKPPPIKKLEMAKGGFGIVLDDLLAGLYANMSLRLLIVVFTLFAQSS